MDLLRLPPMFVWTCSTFCHITELFQNLLCWIVLSVLVPSSATCSPRTWTLSKMSKTNNNIHALPQLGSIAMKCAGVQYPRRNPLTRRLWVRGTWNCQPAWVWWSTSDKRFVGGLEPWGGDITTLALPSHNKIKKQAFRFNRGFEEASSHFSSMKRDELSVDWKPKGYVFLASLSARSIFDFLPLVRGVWLGGQAFFYTLLLDQEGFLPHTWWTPMELFFLLTLDYPTFTTLFSLVSWDLSESACFICFHESVVYGSFSEFQLAPFASPLICP